MSTLKHREAIAEIVENWRVNTKVSFTEMRRRMGRYLNISDPYAQKSFARRFRNDGDHLNTDYPLEDVLALIKSVYFDIPKGGSPCTLEEVVKLFSLTGNTSPILIPYPNEDKPNPYIQEIEAIFSPTGLSRLRMQFLQQWGISSSDLDSDQTGSLPYFQIPVTPKPYYKFVGRKAELDKLSALVRKHERVSIHGMAGIGKSHLAKQFAKQASDFCAIFWLSVGEQPILAQILLKIARDIYPNFAFDATEFNLQHQVQRLFSQFVVQNCEKPLLVILDDVWTGASLQVTYQLLEMLSYFEAHIIVTTRFHEVTRTLQCEPLAIAGLAKFTEADAEALFKAILLEELQIEAQYIQQLCELLDYHPLAMNIAGRVINSLMDPQSDIQELIETYKQGISEGIDFEDLQFELGDTRDSSLNIAIGLAYQHLSDIEKKFFRYLGILVIDHPFSIELGSKLWETEALPHLRSFYAQSLLEKEDSNFQQHRLIRAYSRAKLKHDIKEFDQAREAYARYIRGQFYQFLIENNSTWYTLLEIAHHIHEVIVLLIDNQQYEAALDLQLQFDHQLKRWGEYEHLLYNHSLFPESMNSQKSSDAAMNIAQAYLEQGKLDKAKTHYEKALHLSDEEDPRVGAIYGDLALIAYYNSQLDIASSQYQIAYTIAHDTKNFDLQVKWLIGLSNCLFDLGKVHDGYKLLQEAKAAMSNISASVFRQELEIILQNHLARFEIFFGNHAQSLADLETAEETSQAIHHVYLNTVTLGNLGYHHYRAGNSEQAEYYLKKAISRSEQYHLHMLQGQLLHSLALLNLDKGNLDIAQEMAGLGMSIGESLANQQIIGRNAIILALCALFNHDLKEARQFIHLATEKVLWYEKPFAYTILAILDYQSKGDDLKNLYHQTITFADQVLAIVPHDREATVAKKIIGLLQSPDNLSKHKVNPDEIDPKSKLLLEFI